MQTGPGPWDSPHREAGFGGLSVVRIRNIFDERQLGHAEVDDFRSGTAMPVEFDREGAAALQPDGRLHVFWQHRPSGGSPDVKATTDIEGAELVDVSTEHERAPDGFQQSMDALSGRRRHEPRGAADSSSSGAAIGLWVTRRTGRSDGWSENVYSSQAHCSASASRSEANNWALTPTTVQLPASMAQ